MSPGCVCCHVPAKNPRLIVHPPRLAPLTATDRPLPDWPDCASSPRRARCLVPVSRSAATLRCRVPRKLSTAYRCPGSSSRPRAPAVAAAAPFAPVVPASCAVAGGGRLAGRGMMTFKVNTNVICHRNLLLTQVLVKLNTPPTHL